MGGCRCTYRNCTVKSDGKTHMFHYPVFDKARCHQWLINAQRLVEFLNLSVSQLRNRVVCQHHFKDECFMNYTKGKLTHNAIPTEDGPFCSSSKDGTQTGSNSKVCYPIVLNEPVKGTEPIFYGDKKAKKSMKYVDFLLKAESVDDKCDLIDNTVVIIPPPVPQKSAQVTSKQLETFQSLIIKDEQGDAQQKQNEVPSYKNNLIQFTEIPIETNFNIDNIDHEKRFQHADSLLVNQVPSNSIILNMNDNNVLVENGGTVITTPETNTLYHVQPVYITTVNPTDAQEPSGDIKQQAFVDSYHQTFYKNSEQNEVISNENTNLSNNAMPRNNKPKDSKIRILSEKTISNPIPMTGKLDPISPSFILPLPNRKKDVEPLNQCRSTDVFTNKTFVESPNNQPEKFVKLEFEQTSYKPEIIKIENITNNQNTHDTQEFCSNETLNDTKCKTLEKNQNNSTIKKTNENSPKMTIFKHKMPPERIAAIEKKRNFNKKLRDIIESCLENSEERAKEKQDDHILKEKETDNNLNQNVGSILSKESTLSSAPEYTIAYLEARMKRMENLLSKKIEQNSKRIVELKQSVAPCPKKRTTTSTQTPFNEEAYKKHLYQEISKFLSPTANNLVYEELFINKYSQKLTEQPCPKRKKRR